MKWPEAVTQIVTRFIERERPTHALIALLIFVVGFAAVVWLAGSGVAALPKLASLISN